MNITVTNIFEGAAAIAILCVAFQYHLGWNHGWELGYRSGNSLNSKEGPEENQPIVKNLTALPYALGWHHGWDYGFRKGSRTRKNNANPE